MAIKKLKKPMYKTQEQYNRSYGRTRHMIDNEYRNMIGEISSVFIGKRSDIHGLKVKFAEELKKRYPEIPMELFTIRLDKDNKNTMCIDVMVDVLTEFAVTAYNSYGNNKCKVCGREKCTLKNKHKGCCARFIPQNLEVLLKNIKEEIK